jgi:glycosyltransferase involved in cell wall biosynthesis
MQDSPKINIAYIIDEIPSPNGGTEGQLLMLLRNLDKCKFSPHLVVLRGSEWLENSGLDVNIKVLDLTKLLSLKAIRKLFVFRKFCQANRIEIIQTYFNDSFIFAVLAGKFAGVKTIISCRRNLGPGFWGRKSLLFFFRLLKFITTKYLANSQATKESIVQFESIRPERVGVIYNGLNLERFAGMTESFREECRQKFGFVQSHFVIGMVSHFRPEKNIPLFIKAGAIISKKFPAVRFILVGGGPLEESIKSQIKDMGLEYVFLLPGPIMDVVPYLAAMDIACLTSDGESYSNAIIEYMAAGLPVVATSVGGTIEALQNTGILIPPHDESALVSSILGLIEDPVRQKELSAKGKKEAFEKYSVEKMITEYENVYEDFICRTPL